MTMLDDQQVAQAAADGEEARRHLLRILNDGSVAVLLSLGHQVGLLDALADLPPSGSAQLADAADSTSATSGSGSASSPRAWPTTTRRPGPTGSGRTTHRWWPGRGGQLARQMQYVTLMAEVTPGRREVPHRRRRLSEYPRFQAIMAERRGRPGRLTGADDRPACRRGERLEAGIDVADFGCGSGHAVNLLAAAYPASRFTGLDFSAAAIESAAGGPPARPGQRGVRGGRRGDRAAARRHDLVTAFDAIHDQAHPATVLSAIHSSLRPGGTFLMVDIKASSHLENNLGLPWAGFRDLDPALHVGLPSARAARGSGRCGARSSRRGCCVRPASRPWTSGTSRRTRSTPTSSPVPSRGAAQPAATRGLVPE